MIIIRLMIKMIIIMDCCYSQQVFRHFFIGPNPADYKKSSYPAGVD